MAMRLTNVARAGNRTNLTLDARSNRSVTVHIEGLDVTADQHELIVEEARQQRPPEVRVYNSGLAPTKELDAALQRGPRLLGRDA